MDREAWRAVVHGVAKSRTWLSDWTELNWWLYMIPHAPKPTLWPHILQISPLFMPLKALIVSLLFLKYINYCVLPHSLRVLRVLRSNKPQRVVVVTPWTVARPAPLSMGFSKQEQWSGLPFPSPGDLPGSGIKLWGLLHGRQMIYQWTMREARPLYKSPHCPASGVAPSPPPHSCSLPICCQALSSHLPTCFLRPCFSVFRTCSSLPYCVEQLSFPVQTPKSH